MPHSPKSFTSGQCATAARSILCQQMGVPADMTDEAWTRVVPTGERLSTVIPSGRGHRLLEKREQPPDPMPTYLPLQSLQPTIRDPVVPTVPRRCSCSSGSPYVVPVCVALKSSIAVGQSAAKSGTGTAKTTPLSLTHHFSFSVWAGLSSECKH